MLKSASGRHDLRSPRRRIPRSAISARPGGARLFGVSVYAFVMQSRYLWSRGQLSNIVIAKDGHANHYAPYGNLMETVWIGHHFRARSAGPDSRISGRDTKWGTAPHYTPAVS